jgi:hypothetical protein
MGTGWTVSSGRLICTTGTPADSNGAVLSCTTSLGVIEVTIRSSGTDADGFNLANGYFVATIDELVVVLETSSLIYGAHWVGIRSNSILNPDADSTAAGIAVASFSGSKTAPFQLDPGHQGVDVESSNYIVVKPEAGGTAKIRRINLLNRTSAQGGVRFTNIAFEWQPEEALGVGDGIKSLGMVRVGIDDVLIDNCTFQSTITTTDDVPICCIITNNIVDKLVIQDNVMNDYDHILVNPYECTNLQFIGNECRVGWADQIFFNSGGQNVRINWNIITDKKHKIVGSHPDFIQIAANSADNNLDNFEFIGNQLYRGVGVENQNDGQGIFIKDIPYVAVYSNMRGGTFAAAQYVKGNTSNAIARIASKGNGTLRLLDAESPELATLFIPGETLSEYDTYDYNTNAVSHPTGVTATLDMITALNVTNLVVRGNFISISLTNAIYCVRPVDALIRNNTAILDPTTFKSPTKHAFIVIVGRSSSPGTVADNITNQVTLGAGITNLTEENNSELPVSQVAYHAVFDSPAFGSSLTDPATQYAIASGTTEGMVNPKRGAHQDYVNYTTRTISLPIR